MIRFLAIAAATMFAVSLAQAQNVGQREVNLFEQSAGGEPAVCGLEFTFAFIDNVYGAGIGGMTGSLSNAVVNGQFVTIYKVVATMGVDRTKVYSASLKVGNEFLKPAPTPCNNSLDYCGVFYLADTFKIMKSELSEIDVRYNLQEHGLDYSFPISIPSANNYQTGLTAFLECRRFLFGKLTQQLQ